MNHSKPIQVIAVTGGKGGVGKTSLSVNLSMALAERRQRVLLLDADLGLGNVDVFLGLKPERTLADVIQGRASLRDVTLQGPEGVRIVPASSGVQHMTELSPREQSELIRSFSELAHEVDTMVVDTAAGISDNVVSFVRASQEVIIVVCDDPSSIRDAHALITLLNKEHGMVRFRVVANMTRSVREGNQLFNKLHSACEDCLDVALQYEGHIPFDDRVRQAIQKQQPLLTLAPQCRASQAIRTLARKVDDWPLPQAASGRLEFFVEQLVNSRAIDASY